MTTEIQIHIRSDQYDYLESEAARLKISPEKAMLIFLLDGRLTPRGGKKFCSQGVKRLSHKRATKGARA